MQNNSSAQVEVRGPRPADEIQWWLYGVFIPLICIPGIFANLCSLAVFTRPAMRSSINTYLAALSAFDSAVLLLSLLVYPPMRYCENGLEGFCSFWTYSVIVTYPLSLLAQFGSVWTCVSITVDRFHAVRYPLRVRELCTSSKARHMVCGILIVGFIYQLPTAFELKIVNGVVRQTDLRNHPVYRQVYKLWLYLFCLYVIPFAIMIVLNVFLANSLHIAFRQREQMTSLPSQLSSNASTASRASGAGSLRLTRHNDKERRCTLMALVVILTFILFNALAVVNMILEVAAVRWDQRLVRSMIFLGNTLVCVNSATNFIIYCALGVRFRRMFFKLFIPCLLRSLPDRVGGYSAVGFQSTTGELTTKRASVAAQSNNFSLSTNHSSLYSDRRTSCLHSTLNGQVKYLRDHRRSVATVARLDRIEKSFLPPTAETRETESDGSGGTARVRRLQSPASFPQEPSSPPSSRDFLLRNVSSEL